MSKQGWVYIWAVFLAAITFAFVSIPETRLSATQWHLFLILTLLGSLAQMFHIEAPKEQTYFATPLCFFAGILLLDPALLVLVIVIAHLAEWFKERWVGSSLLRNWYTQPFNIAKHIIASLTAATLYDTLNHGGSLYTTFGAVVAVSVAALCYVLLNQMILGFVLILARGVSLRDSGSLDAENMLTEYVIAVLGYSVAIGWQLNPWLIPLLLTPLALCHRALAVHKLKVEAQTDSKTGLWNARHFATLFANELERSQRFHRPAAVIMADLDLLRNINNTYGHLAGDTVLAGIGQIIKKSLRDYDIAARFGGEEFAIVLPEVTQDEARAMAERVRMAIEAATFQVATSPTPLQATMSLGIACFPADGQSTNDLIHAADVAVYQAKIQGRNRVVCSADVPQFVRLEHEAVENRLGGSYSIAFTPRPEGITGIQAHPPATALPGQPITTKGITSASAGVLDSPSTVATAPANTKYAPLPRRMYVLVALVVSAALGTVLAGFATAPVINLSMLGTVGGLGVLVFVLLLALLLLSQKLYVSHAEHSVRQIKRMNEQVTTINRELFGANTQLNQRHRELQRLNGEQRRTNDELFIMLARILDAHDPFVDSHAGQVATYAVAIAAELELPPERVKAVRQAGYLHDIGKIALSERILYKPARLTTEEYEMVKKHARIGGELLAGAPSLKHLASAVRHHHERWDGTGYPDGLMGPEIPLEARILSLCDAVEAMASDRPYHQSKSPTDIVAELKACAGTQFDPGVVAAFVRLVEREGGQMIVNAARAAAFRPADAPPTHPGDVWNYKEQPVAIA